MLHTLNRTQIHAPPELVYQLAADIGRWPELLEHYRYVHLLEEGRTGSGLLRRRAKMSASRSGIPVSWTATQELRPRERCILYHHVAGVTKGMDVVWRIEVAGQIAQVSIEHSLLSSRWWMRTRLAGFIVGRIFVANIADRTLRGIKRHAEDQATMKVS